MASITVSLLAETRGIRKGIDDVNGRLSRFGKGLKGLAVASAAAFSAGAAIQFGKDVVNSASNAQQSIGATEQIFGKYADTVIKRSKEAAQSVGLSANEYRELSNQTGAMLANAGTPLKKVADLTDQLNSRAADMAATFGGTTKDAVSAVSSLLRGEADPIERYGVSIKQSDVNARLAAQGLSGLTGEAKKQAEQQARLDLLFKQTGKTAGQFAKESNTLAGQQQRVSAQWENMKAKLGTLLLPILTKVFAYINSTVLPALERWGPKVLEIASAFGGAVGKVKEFFTGLSGSGDTSAKFQEVMGTIKSVIENVKSIISSVVSIATSLWAKFGADIQRYVQVYFPAMLSIVRGVFNVLAGMFKTIAAVLKGDWSGAWAGIKQIAKGAGQAIVGIVKISMAATRLAITVALKSALAIVKSVFSGMRAAASAAGTAVGQLIRAGFNRARDGAASALSSLLGKVRALPGQIKGALAGLAGALYSVGVNMIQGLINGIQAMAGRVAGAAKAVVNNAVNAAKSALKIHSPSRVMIGIGRFVSQGLAIGIKQDGKKVTDTLQTLTNKIRDAFRTKKSGLSKSELLAGLKVIDKYDGKLVRNAERREKVAKRLAAAQQKLTDLVKAQADYAANITSNARSYANITSITPGENETLNSKTLIQGLADRLNAIRNFNNKLNSLKGKLNKTTYDQIAQAGVEGGTATLEALVAGGGKAVSEVNRLQTLINSASGVLGQNTAQNMYGAGVQAAAGLVKGLSAKSAALTKAASTLAKNLVKAVKKALGIKSPSRVFKNEIGANVVDGFILGLDTRAVARQGYKMSNALTSQFEKTTLKGSVALSAPSSKSQSIEIKLSAEQLTAMQRGQAITADIKAYEKAVGI